ncbi:MAG: GtrA family protein [Candidatus Sericytochromatia bacterium]
MFKHLWNRYATFLRYVVVGVLGTAIDLGVLYGLTELSGVDPRTSPWFALWVALAFLAAVVNNYLLNRFWTFKSRDRNVSAQFFRFLLVSVGGFLLTQLLMWVLVTLLGVWYLLAKAITSVLILVWNFGLNKMWTFRAAASETTPALL